MSTCCAHCRERGKQEGRVEREREIVAMIRENAAAQLTDYDCNFENEVADMIERDSATKGGDKSKSDDAAGGTGSIPGRAHLAADPAKASGNDDLGMSQNGPETNKPESPDGCLAAIEAPAPGVETKSPPQPELRGRDELKRDLAAVLNRHSAENHSNTPDFILAEAVLGALDVMGHAMNERDRWYGVKLSPGVSAEARTAMTVAADSRAEPAFKKCHACDGARIVAGPNEYETATCRECFDGHVPATPPPALTRRDDVVGLILTALLALGYGPESIALRQVRAALKETP